MEGLESTVPLTSLRDGKTLCKLHTDSLDYSFLISYAMR